MTLTLDKLGNGPVALLATLTVFFEQFIGDTLDLKTQVLALELRRSSILMRL